MVRRSEPKFSLEESVAKLSNVTRKKITLPPGIKERLKKGEANEEDVKCLRTIRRRVRRVLKNEGGGETLVERDRQILLQLQSWAREKSKAVVANAQGAAAGPAIPIADEVAEERSGARKAPAQRPRNRERRAELVETKERPATDIRSFLKKHRRAIIVILIGLTAAVRYGYVLTNVFTSGTQGEATPAAVGSANPGAIPPPSPAFTASIPSATTSRIASAVVVASAKEEPKQEDVKPQEPEVSGPPPLQSWREMKEEVAGDVNSSLKVFSASPITEKKDDPNGLYFQALSYVLRLANPSLERDSRARNLARIILIATPSEHFPYSPDNYSEFALLSEIGVSILLEVFPGLDGETQERLRKPVMRVTAYRLDSWVKKMEMEKDVEKAEKFQPAAKTEELGKFFRALRGLLDCSNALKGDLKGKIPTDPRTTKSKEANGKEWLKDIFERLFALFGVKDAASRVPFLKAAAGVSGQDASLAVAWVEENL